MQLLLLKDLLGIPRRIHLQNVNIVHQHNNKLFLTAEYPDDDDKSNNNNNDDDDDDDNNMVATILVYNTDIQH